MPSNQRGKVNVAVIGLGGMGSRWAEVACSNEDSVLYGVTDVDVVKVKAAAERFGCKAYSDWREVTRDSTVEAVVVATPHALLAEISKAALEAGKHVFCEKPGGISSAEVAACAEIAKKSNLRYRVNYNMRLHPAVAEAKRRVDMGEIGKILFIRGVYAHGGREGYEKEWWCNPKLSGGGCLIGQGCHLVDLANWFLGPFQSVTAHLETLYWPIEPADDNVFVLLKNKAGRAASLHASWSHWKKTFLLEIYGDNGYLIVEGLGGQYGVERLIVGEKKFGREQPCEEVLEFPEEAGLRLAGAGYGHAEAGKPDTALKNSWAEFLESIREGRDAGSSSAGAISVFELMEAAGRSSKEKRTEFIQAA